MDNGRLKLPETVVIVRITSTAHFNGRIGHEKVIVTKKIRATIAHHWTQFPHIKKAKQNAEN